MSSEPIIQARNLGRVYRTGRGEVRALDEVNLEIARGEYVSVMGPSGSGKSTLFNLIGALDRPTAGEILIGGVSLGNLTSRQAAYFRGRYLGYVFQSFNLIPSLTALKNVALPAQLAGTPLAQALEQAAKALTDVGLDHRLNHRPDELSGGQQQRVAIARAIVNRPAIILADEPTANLDLDTGKQIITLLRSLCDTHGVTVVCATHDHEMLAVSDRIVMVADGRIQRIAGRGELHVRVGSIA